MWSKVAIASLVAAALAATFTCEWDCDAFWHVASGEWMLRNHRVLDFDPFTSEPEPSASRWVNVYWLFQLVLAGLRSLGGWESLTVLQSVLTGAALLLFALSLRRHVPGGWLVFSGLLSLLVFSSRIRLRPEMFTLPFLMASVVLVEHVRRGGPTRRLWWLTPLVLVWANMHGLYVLAFAVMWGGMLGGWLDRRLGRGELAGGLGTRAALVPMLAGTAACLATPWPVESALHPLLLWTRISGQSEAYRYGVYEFLPTWQYLSSQRPAIILAGAAVLALVLNARKAPLAHAVWLVPFLALAAMAIRNVALLAPVCGVVLAWHGGALLRRLAEGRPRLGRLGPAASAASAILATVLAFDFAAEYAYRGDPQRKTGAGLYPHRFMIGLAEYLRDLPAPGDVLAVDFGHASTFLHHCFPHRKVWMDGRLEIKSLSRFERFLAIGRELSTPEGADRCRLPESVRFVIVAQDDHPHLSALAESKLFGLVRLDSAGACFARLDWRDSRPAAEALPDLPPRPNLDDFDRPLTEEGFIEGVRANPPRWYRQNPVSEYAQVGGMLGALGQRRTPARPGEALPSQRRCSLLAARYWTAALNEGAVQPDVARGLLAQWLWQWARQTGESAGAAVPVDVNQARALRLLARMDLAKVPRDKQWGFGLLRVRCLEQAGHLDAASGAAADLGKALGRSGQAFHAAMLDSLRAKVRAAEDRAEALEWQGVPPLRQAEALASREGGLTLGAIRRLESVPERDANAQTLLGDLLLRLGRPGEAAQAYRVALEKGASVGEIALRLALCEWVDGDLSAALVHLGGGQAGEGSPSRPAGKTPLTHYYRGLLLEQMGRYEAAGAAFRAAADGAGPDLARLISLGIERLPPVAAGGPMAPLP